MDLFEKDRITADRFIQEEKFLEALKIYNDIIGNNPSDVQAWVGVGMVMVRTLQWDRASETFKFVLQMEPRNWLAMYGLSMVLVQQGDPRAAGEIVDAACQLAPTAWQPHQWRAYVHAATAGADPVRILALYQEWGRKFADPLTDRAQPLPPLRQEHFSPKRRLKVGYVSGDLRQHAVAFFMEPVFAHHNPELVDVYVYATGPRDSFTQRIAAHVPNWFDVFPLSDDDLCALIRRHEIDVLVDLSGHTVGHRLFTFARRAAPVQVTWMGFMGPLGMKAMDYRLTDALLSPPGAEAHSSEKLFRLSRVLSYTPPTGSPEVADLPMLSNKHPTLISLNNAKKVTDEMLAVWREILARRPDVHLILMSQELDQEGAEKQLLPRLMRLDFPLDRIRISKQLSLNAFMAMGNVADVALDTSPISGGTTTMHTLWMGLPVVTLEGHDETSGYTAGILRGLGHGDWVAADAQAYIRTVLALLEQPEHLQEHRRTIRQRLQASPLMNYAERTAELERAYRLMWVNHLLGEPRYLDARHDPQVAMQQVATRQAQAE